MDWSLCAWCGKDFERREVPAAAAVEALPRGRDATDRISAASVSTATTATPLPSSVRNQGPARPATTPTIPASAQDPLPER
jgi:hypothetical protein